jgi:hypothetical protein
MTQKTDLLDRRTAVKKGGLVATTLAVGLPAISGTAAAAHIPTMNVDVPPTISAEPKGQVTIVIYPGGDMDPEGVLHEVEDNNGGFKLGPHDGDEPDPDELEPHADAVRWRLVNNGIHGTVLGVFFDASTAAEGAWFTSDDDAAKVSAVLNGSEGIDEDEDIIAWGSDRVEVRATPSPN